MLTAFTVTRTIALNVKLEPEKAYRRSILEWYFRAITRCDHFLAN